MYPLVRALRSQDLDAVIQIEQASYPFPWTRGIFEECLRAGYACFGLQLDTFLVGYSVYNWGAGESHLLPVHPPGLAKEGLRKNSAGAQHQSRPLPGVSCHVPGSSPKQC